VTPSPSPAIAEVVAAIPAPWWGVPVVAGSFLLVGALLGFLFNRSNEDRKAKREADIRWHRDIRVLVAELLKVGDDHWDVSRRLMRRDANPHPEEDLDRALSEEIVRALNVLRMKKVEISLIAPETLDMKAMSYANLVLSADDTIEQGLPEDEVYDLILMGKYALIDALRAELKIEPKRKRPVGR